MEGGADFIVAETFDLYEEAKFALDAILKYGKGEYDTYRMPSHNIVNTVLNMQARHIIRLHAWSKILQSSLYCNCD